MEIKESEKVIYNCPFCNYTHELDKLTGLSECIIDDTIVKYIETVYYCPIEDHVFDSGELLDKNLKAAREAYKLLKELNKKGD